MKKFFTIIGTVLVGCSVGTPSSNASSAKTEKTIADPDSVVFSKLVETRRMENWDTGHIDSLTIKVATCFLGVPYVPHTLEADGPERLVVNLREMDCTTLVENVLAISWCLSRQQTGYADFKRALTRLRYRHGVVDQYPSRLHYFTDWLMDNRQKGLVELVSQQFATEPFTPHVGFMSAHPDKYRALATHPEFVEPIRQQEAIINKYALKFIPKADVPKFEDRIRNGDIIAIATDINGLDVAHVGFALHHQGRLHMLHASLTEKKVMLTPMPLADYLMGIKKHSGILVARPLAK
ncbi:MAG: DUF1460 domain-containing protein [Breznakibacter sp.]